MLAADKIQLQSLMKQQAVTLKEKEFNLHHSNCMTIGTQAAVLAGLDITTFIEFTPLSLRDYIFGPEIADAMASVVAATTHHHVHGGHYPLRSLATTTAAMLSSAAVITSRNMNGGGDDSSDSNDTSDTASMMTTTNDPASSFWMKEYILYYTILYHVLHFLYYSLICTAFCCNVIVVAQTTILSVLGAGLALRGPDGSMMTATNILYEERSRIFRIFGFGLTLTILSVLVGVWIMFRHWATALSCWSIATFTCYYIYSNYQRVSKLLYFHDNESVDLQDLLSITQQQHPPNTRSKPSTKTRNDTSRVDRHLSYNNNEGAVTGEEYYDDDDTFYSSENPETESFLNHNNTNDTNSRRRRSKYNQQSQNRRNNTTTSTIQMV